MPIPPEAADLANEANSVFVDEDYETALELYTQVRSLPALPRLSWCARRQCGSAGVAGAGQGCGAARARARTAASDRRRALCRRLQLPQRAPISTWRGHRCISRKKTSPR
jgi:hypothetical protein